MFPADPLRRAAVWACIALGAAADPLLACAVCFGDPNSNLAKGTKAGILVLLVIVYGVVLMMVGVAGLWFVRSRRVAARRQDAPPDNNGAGLRDDPVEPPS